MTRKKGGGRESDGPCCEQAKWTPDDAWSCQIHDKGGGRESGGPSALGVGLRPEQAREGASKPTAANPAASRHAFFAGIGQCSDEAPICFGCMERIRAFEAELAGYDTLGGRLKMKDFRQMQADQENAEALEIATRRALDEAVRECNKREARVKELRRLLGIRFEAEIHGWSLEEREAWITLTNAKLRGDGERTAK